MSIINANSSSLTDVQAAVNSAAVGDTVVVPSGSSTWSGSITLTRGIIIQGAGIDVTTLTRGGVLFSIAPSALAITNEELIKITGFTFNGNNSALVLIDIVGAGASSTKAFKNLVIGVCKFKNTGTSTSGSGAISSIGQIRGVIYGNTFDRCNVVLKILGNDSTDEWENPAFNNFSFGSADSLFFEANTILFSSSFSGADPGWTETGQGARLVCRYNSWNMANATQQELWDIHGFQNWDGSPNSGQTGTMISEYYGNTATNCSGYRWINHRGSWGLFFNNIVTGSGAMDIDINGMSPNGHCTSDISPDPTGVYIPEVNNSYFWNNTDDGVISSAGLILEGCGVTENNSWWNFNASFNGTSGIGRGTSAPSGNCTTGVGYWKATTATPTTDPAVIQAGTFYKATATNVWTAYYTPYTYPHPLSVTGGGGSLTFTVLTQPTKGTLSGTAPNLVFTPTLNATGADSFTFKVNDGVLDSATATVSINITPVNDIPVANAMSVVLLEDTITSIVLTGSDVEGSPLVFTVLTQPTKGVLSGTAPNLIYTPTLNATGADSFTFKVNDGVADSATKTVSITITPVADIPVADAKSVVLLEDAVTPIVLTGSGGDGPLTFTVLTQPTKGVLSGTAPNLTYTPTLNATGADNFTFKVTASGIDSTTKTVSITITPVADPPIANPKTVVLLEDAVTPIVLTGSP